MRRNTIGVFLGAVGFGLLIVGCGKPFLLFENSIPEFTAPADKALCVVIRPSQAALKAVTAVARFAPGPKPAGASMAGGFDANALAKLYIDGKLVGGLKENSVTSFEVEPGERLLLSYVKNMAKIKFNFQPGKVYYVMQTLMPVPIVGTGQAIKPITPDEYKAKLADNKGALRYTRLNPEVPPKDLNPKDVQDELKEWKKWAEKNPEEAKAELEYPGY